MKRQLPNIITIDPEKLTHYEFEFIKRISFKTR